MLLSTRFPARMRAHFFVLSGKIFWFCDSIMKKQTWQKKLDLKVDACGAAARKAAAWDIKLRNKILDEAARQIEKESAVILRANQKDLDRAAKSGIAPAMIDRLTLNAKRIKAMAEGIRSVRKLPDPIGKVIYQHTGQDGLRIQRVTVPLGVILIIFESRPNVTVECAALALKSGNAVILRGGREAFESNLALVKIFRGVLVKYKLPQEVVSFIDTTDYETVDYLLKQEGKINLVIPRGGQGLIKSVVEKSRIPVVKHYQGICHVFVDAKADLKKAAAIAENAKLQRPGVCNAMETLLVHEKIAAKFLPLVAPRLLAGGCEVRGDAATRKYISWAKTAKANDYGQEFLDKILAVRVVKDLNAAIEHITKYGSGHTDAIVTRDRRAAQTFREQIDSSSVMINASTRFADGFEYGLGAEIGISTDKVHARGPMGLEGLTSYKYVVTGSGHIRR